MPVGALTDVFIKGLGDAAAHPLGLAVSGGGDSMAMLHLAHRAGLAVQVATVDHGLREGSAAEAAQVARVCAQLGVAHSTLLWRDTDGLGKKGPGWTGQGNLQDQARLARRRLLAAWAVEQRLPCVAMAHSMDDLAETFLMRLARGAGVDGLSAMVPRWHEGGVVWVRPLLAVSRDDLRGYLTGLGAGWAEDPSNDALRFDRVKARKALKSLGGLGITVPRLAEVAQNLADARVALEAVADAAAVRHVSVAQGIVSLAPGLFDEAVEIQRRLVLRVILWTAPTAYGPRGAALQQLLAKLRAGKAAQLAGCHFVPHQGRVLAFREAASTQGPVDGTAVWDGCWRFEGAQAGDAICALGASGLALLPGWRGLGLPRSALLSAPSLWRGDQLLAAPAAADLMATGGNWRAIRHPKADVLFHRALSH